MNNNADKKKEETGLIRVNDELLDKVRLQAFKNKISMKDYVEQLILKNDNEIKAFETSEDIKNKTDTQNNGYEKIKVEIEGHIYVHKQS